MLRRSVIFFLLVCVAAVSADWAVSDARKSARKSAVKITNHRLALEQSDVFADAGDIEGQRAMLDRALELDPCGNCAASALNNRALIIAYYDDNFEKALDDVNTAIRLNPDIEHYYDTRAQIHLFMGNHESAAADFQTVKSMGQHGLEYQLRQGVAYFSLMVSSDSTNANAYAYRGVIYLLREEFDKAAADFESARRLDANNALVRRYNEYAVQRRNIINFNEGAIRDWEYNNRAIEAAFHNGNFERGVELISNAIRLNPREGYFYSARANMHLFMDNHDLALRDFKAINALGVHDHRYMLRKSIEYFGRMISSDRSNANAYAWRGVMHILREEFNEASADFERARQLDANNAVVGRYNEYAVQRRNILNFGEE